MHDTITFHQLEHVILQAGFKPQRVAGRHRVYGYPDGKTVVVLPYQSSKKPVPRMYIYAVRRILKENGLLSEEQFDRLISKT